MKRKKKTGCFSPGTFSSQASTNTHWCLSMQGSDTKLLSVPEWEHVSIVVDTEIKDSLSKYNLPHCFSNALLWNPWQFSVWKLVTHPSWWDRLPYIRKSRTICWCALPSRDNKTYPIYSLHDIKRIHLTSNNLQYTKSQMRHCMSDPLSRCYRRGIWVHTPLPIYSYPTIRKCAFSN